MQGVERAFALVCAVLPVAGVLFFGWSLATVLFVIWLDTWLHSLRIIPGVGNEDWFEPYAEHPVGRVCLNLLFGIMFWLIVSAPLMSVVGLAFHELAWQIRPGGFRAEFHDLLFHAPWWLAIIVGSRLFPCMRELIAARAESRQRLVGLLKAEFFIGLTKCVVLLPLAWFARLFADGGYRGVLAFAAFASITIVAADWYLQSRLTPRPRPPKPAKPLEVVHGFDGRTPER